MLVDEYAVIDVHIFYAHYLSTLQSLILPPTTTTMAMVVNCNIKRPSYSSQGKDNHSS